MLLQTAAEKHKQVKKILSVALELAPAERENFLAAHDADIRREVESFLQIQTEAENFLKGDSVVAVVRDSYNRRSDELPGRIVDRYKIEKEIGRGGMGVVFLARREDFQQTVALKLIKRGMDSDQILERFKREREILAALNHPNIARLIDGGTTGDGAPFFVMEFVEGVSVNEFCRINDLSEQDKLALFRKICAAVSFAHQKLIVHRDLKPSNILVTAGGEPKLLDFGIAKLLAVEDANETKTNQRVLTPAYASPEQMRGEAVSTASDVYSLGVILRELLTEEKISRFEELKKWKSESEDSLESEKRTDKNSRRATRGLRFFKGDLRNIVSMATREEAQLRYQTVEAFGEDVRRYLDGLPVAARRQTISYLTAKFFRRHWRALAASAAVGAVLVAILMFIFFQRAGYERKISELDALSQSLALASAPTNGNSRLESQTQAAQNAVENLNRLSNEISGDRNLQLKLVETYIKLGDLQGKPYAANIGNAEGARVSYQKALQILNAVAPENADDIRFRQLSVEAEMRYGYLLMIRLSEVEEGFERLEEAVQASEEIFKLHPAEPRAQQQLADAYTNFADALSAKKLHYRPLNPSNEELKQIYSESLPYLRRALDLRSKLQGEHPSDLQFKRELSNGYERLGFLTYRSSASGADKTLAADGIAALEKCLKLREEIEESPAATIQDSRTLADAYLMIAIPQVELRQSDDAIENLRQARKIFQTLIFSDSQNVEARRDLANVLYYWGLALAGQNKKAQARERLTNAHNILQEIQDQTSEDTYTIRMINQNLEKL